MHAHGPPAPPPLPPQIGVAAMRKTKQPLPAFTERRRGVPFSDMGNFGDNLDLAADLPPVGDL